jgi:hypothetical protein
MLIRELRQQAKPHWLILGDFNLIYKVQDKNNAITYRGLMSRFKRL